MKILLICNESNTVINFRKELILFLLNKGHDISLIAADNKRENEIENLGVKFLCCPYSNRSKNIFSSLKLLDSFKKQIELIQPDLVFTFQIKPNIFGTYAAKHAGVKNIYSMIEGLGDPFQPKNLRGKPLRSLVSYLYTKALKNVKTVFVLNNDDRNELISRKMVDNPDKICLIPGIGIDTKKYMPNYQIPKEKRVIMLSRLIKNKGILDYCEIAREVHKTRKDIVFELYGQESELTKRDIEQYISGGSIFYGGFTKQGDELIAHSRIVLSATSYREGFPRIVLEAMALGRTIVASKVVGNVDAIEDGKTGFLIPVHDITAFSKKIIEIIDNDSLLEKIGRNAREKCEKYYDSNIINQKISDVIFNQKKEGNGND